MVVARAAASIGLAAVTVALLGSGQVLRSPGATGHTTHQDASQGQEDEELPKRKKRHVL